MSTEPEAPATPEAATPGPDQITPYEQPSSLEPEGQLVHALAAAQAAFPELKKTKEATVRPKNGGTPYTYSYADLADVLATVRPVLAAHGLALIQRTVYDAGRLMLRTELLHAGGGHLSTEVAIEQSPANAQQFGGALTYMRRYELVTLLGVQADEDLDAQQVESVQGQRPTPALPAWAAPASDARKREWRDTIAPLIGKDRALEFGKMLADTWEYMPDGAVAIAKQLVVYLETELGPDLALLAQVAADKRATDAAQAAAGETPDTPSPAEEPDRPGPDPSEVPEGAAGPPPTDEPDPQASTIEAPDVEGLDPDEAVEAMRLAGCTCPDPFAEPFDGACPIIKHGIPF